ncbi:MAG: glycosyltransferase family 4 protein [Candidatus Acidiferrales bacterium]
MRILIAIGVPRQEEAGAAGVVLNHARELTKKGHGVECWFLEDVLTPPVRPKRLEALIFAHRAAQRVLRQRGAYDVVNIHAPWACVYGFRRRILRPAGAPPCVMTMQGSEERFVTVMRREQHEGRASNFTWKNRFWHRVYHQQMYDWSIRTADYGAVANREATIMAELKYDRQPGRIRFIPNGVGHEFFVDRSYVPHVPLRLLYVGTWLDRKGVYYLAESFQLLAREVSSVVLTVAGCGNFESEIKASFAPEVRDRVAVVPFVARGAMPSLYAEHDIFVFPSLVEGMPLTLLEAMASGMPVVTTMSSGMADVVENDFNGLLVPPADSPELTSAVRRLCKDVDLRCRLGHEARKTMRRYAWERVTESLEQILMLAVKRERTN